MRWRLSDSGSLGLSCKIGSMLSSAGVRYVTVALCWVAAAFLIKPFYAYVDFGAFYATAIDRILAGRPLEIYSFVLRPGGGDLAIPLSYPPVWFFYLSSWYALGQALGLSDFQRQSGVSWGQAWMLAVTVPFDLVLCAAIVRLSEGAKRLAEPGRLGLFACLLFSPLLWLSSVRYGHCEATMIALVLLAIGAGERRHPIWSGLFWGLAFGIKTTTIVPALIYFGWGLGRQRRRGVMISGVVGAAVFLIPLLPYLILRREQVFYALYGFEQIRPVGGYVLWKLAPGLSSLVSYANLVILGTAGALGLALSRRAGTSFLASGGAWALVLGQAAILLFGKALFVWYPLAASCFLFLAVAREEGARRSALLWPLMATLALWLIQGGAWIGESVTPGIRVRSALWVVLILGMVVFAARRLVSRSTLESPSGSSPGSP